MKINIINKLTIYLGAWIIYDLFYGITKYFVSLHFITGYLSLIAQVSLDLVCMILSYGIAKNTQKLEKCFFTLFSFSFAFNLISDVGYNTIANIIGITNFSFFSELTFDVPFLIFLLLQLNAWFLIFKLIHNRNKHVIRYSVLLYSPFIVSSIIVLLTFFLLPFWRVSLTSTQGLFNSLDSILQVITFAPVVVCLFAAKDKKLSLLTFGYLTIIATDFMVHITQVEKLLVTSSLLEIFWILGLLLFTVGLMSIREDRDFIFESNLYNWNNLKTQINYWLFIVSLLSALILLFINTVFTNLSIRSVIHIPTTFIIFAILSALVSNVIADYLIKPFEYFNNIINVYRKKRNPYQHNRGSKIIIEEFKQLGNCLHEGLNAIKNEQFYERIYIDSVLNYANEIRNPTVAIKMLSEDIDELSDKKRRLLKNAADRIMSITQHVLSRFNKPNSSKDVDAFNLKLTKDPVILIDDNKNLSMAWEMEADEAGVNLTVYNTPEEFINDAEVLDYDAILYIDVNLSETLSGIELSKWAHYNGFKNINLITGGDVSKLKNISWIKSVCGKSPPFGEQVKNYNRV